MVPPWALRALAFTVPLAYRFPGMAIPKGHRGHHPLQSVQVGGLSSCFAGKTYFIFFWQDGRHPIIKKTAQQDTFW